MAALWQGLFSFPCWPVWGKDLNINFISGKKIRKLTNVRSISSAANCIRYQFTAFCMLCLKLSISMSKWNLVIAQRAKKIITIFILDTKKAKCQTEVAKGHTVNRTQSKKLGLLIAKSVLSLPDHAGLTWMEFRWTPVPAIPQRNIKDYAPCYSGSSSTQESRCTESSSEFLWILLYGGKRHLKGGKK